LTRTAREAAFARRRNRTLDARFAPTTFAPPPAAERRLVASARSDPDRRRDPRIRDRSGTLGRRTPRSGCDRRRVADARGDDPEYGAAPAAGEARTGHRIAVSVSAAVALPVGNAESVALTDSVAVRVRDAVAGSLAVLCPVGVAGGERGGRIGHAERRRDSGTGGHRASGRNADRAPNEPPDGTSSGTVTVTVAGGPRSAATALSRRTDRVPRDGRPGGAGRDNAVRAAGCERGARLSRLRRTR
jgi:hypothetical protein